MIDVCVRYDDTPDRGAEMPSSLDYAAATARNACVDKGKAIVLLDQETIDHAEASETNQPFRFLREIHRQIQGNYLTKKEGAAVAIGQDPLPLVFASVDSKRLGNPPSPLE
jgi:hypothetical protein